jgi:hypothetical protein
VSCGKEEFTEETDEELVTEESEELVEEFPPDWAQPTNNTKLNNATDDAKRFFIVQSFQGPDSKQILILRSLFYGIPPQKEKEGFAPTANSKKRMSSLFQRHPRFVSQKIVLIDCEFFQWRAISI